VDDDELDDVARRYEETLRAWSTAVSEGLGNPARANKLFDKQRKDLVRLRVEQRGRLRIEALRAMPIQAFV
jgi:hypothetical protein